MPLDGLLYPKRQPPWLLPAGPFELDRAHPLANGLVGFWPLAGDARDYSKTGAHGTLATKSGSNAAQVVGQFGPSLLFAVTGGTYNDNGSYVSIGQPSALDFTGPCSVSAWVNGSGANAFSSNGCNIFSKGFSAGISTTQWSLAASGGTASWGIYASATSIVASSTFALSTGVWYHLVGVFTGTAYLLYINGVLNATTASTQAPIHTPREVEIAAVDTAGDLGGAIQMYAGYVNGVGAWNRPLSAGEAARLYNEPFGLLRPVSRRILPPAPYSGPPIGTLNVTQADQTLSAAGSVLSGITGILGGSTTTISTVGGATPPGTVLLLHADGANGSTTFVDNSPLAHTLTTVGPAQVSTVAAYFGTGGLDTSASGGFGTAGINTNNATDFNFGAGPFTIEAWCYVTVPFGSNNYAILGQWGSGGNQGFYLTVAPGVIRFYYTTNGSNTTAVSGFYTWPLNTWVHVAVDRDASNNIRIYANGTVLSTTAAAATIFPSTVNVLIGNDLFNESFGGYLDEVLVMKGYAKYGGAFTPSAAPYGSAASPSCVLLMHADGTAGSTTFVDASPSAHTLTATSATINATSKFGNGSANFTASTASRIDTGNAVDFNFGAGPFTVEAWAYVTGVITSPTIAGQMAWSGANEGWAFWLDSTHLYFNYSFDGTARFGTSVAYTIPLSTWVHLAIDRDVSGNVRFYANGSLLTTVVLTNALYPSTLNCIIGNDNSATDRFPGYLDEVRITKGRAMYAGAFSPPLVPFVASNTVLLMHCDGATIADPFIDSSLSANTLTPAGSASIFSLLSKFGTASAQFPFSSSAINVNNATDFNFGAGPFTIEVWAYFTTAPVSAVILDQGGGTAHAIGYTFYADGTHLYLSYSLLGTVVATTVAPCTFTLNTWMHLAVDRDGSGNVRLYQNGVVLSTTSVPGSIYPATANATIGNFGSIGGDNFSGYLDEIRVSKGVARFAGAFTPPAQAYVGDAVSTSGLTQADQTLSAAGTVGGTAPSITGTLNVTQANQTLVAADTVVVSGTLNVTQANQTLAALATLGVSGTLAATQANQTLGATATPVVGGALNILQANQTLAATAVGGETGALSLTQADQTLAATGTLAVVGALSLIQMSQTLVANSNVAALPQTRVVIMA